MDSRFTDLYGQLFSMTPAGQIVGIAPEPLTIAEMGDLREVMRVGLTLFERGLALPR